MGLYKEALVFLFCFYRDPIANGEECLGIEQDVFETCQRSFGIDRTTFREDITIAKCSNTRRALSNDIC